MLYWDCLTLEASEHVPEGLQGDLQLENDYHQMLQMGINGAANLSDPKIVHRLYAAWYRLTVEFTARMLTKESDRLFAFAGMVSEMQKTLAKACELQSSIQEPDSYLAGLWRHDLWRGFLWTLVDQAYQNTGCSRLREPLAPTWSWASVTGFISYLVHENRIKDLEAPDPLVPVTWSWEVLCKIADVGEFLTNSADYNENLYGA
jgi:hypothetical protein